MRRSRKILRAVVLPFIPESIRNSGRIELQVHAYVIVGTLLFPLAMFIGASVLLRDTVSNTHYGEAIGAACITCFFINLLLFRRTASFVLAANLYALPSYVGILLWGYYTGGIASPATPLMLTVPVIVFIMAGRAMGILWLVIVLCTFLVGYYIHLYRVPFHQILRSEDELRLWWMISWFALGIINAIALWVYDLVNRTLASRLEDERNQFAFRAAHDPLTQIANRTTFDAALRSALDECRDERERKKVIVFIDLDQFKPINDMYGHQTGDEVLKTVARRIINSVRETDLTARLGGDEFAVILNDVESITDVERILANLVNQIASPISTRHAVVEVTCSVGAVVCPDQGTDPETLARKADVLMYQAKAHKNSYLLAS